MNKKLKSFEKLPDSPGVYLFKNRAGKILYIGKATSLRDRVRSYMRGDLLLTRGPLIEKMSDVFARVDFKPTNSVLEALVLEAAFIKKYQPPYNTKEKDDKSFNFLVITNEKFPRVLIRRGREIAQTGAGENGQRNAGQDGVAYRNIFGPFTQGRMLKEGLRIVRKIFPYRDACKPDSPRPCFNRQIGLCPGVCTGEITAAEYMRIIRRIELFFEGKTDLLVRNIEKEMKLAAKKREFENAATLRDTLFALQHIRDVTLIGDDFRMPEKTGDSGVDDLNFAENFRIEAYDIAHIGGHSTVGMMVVLENGEIERALGRRFKIRGAHSANGKNNEIGKVKNDDIANLTEILERRFNHPEWPFPDLIVIDGGETHRKATEKILIARGFTGTVVSVVKDERHKPREILHNSADSKIAKKYEAQILLANNEAHRAATSYHKLRRGKDFGVQYMQKRNPNNP